MKALDKTNEELCVLAQQGDADAADRLVRQCLPFIRQQANRLWLRMGLEGKTVVMDPEDLVQEGCSDILAEAKQINAERAAKAEAEFIEDEATQA